MAGVGGSMSSKVHTDNHCLCQSSLLFLEKPLRFCRDGDAEYETRVGLVQNRYRTSKFRKEGISISFKQTAFIFLKQPSRDFLIGSKIFNRSAFVTFCMLVVSDNMGWGVLP